MTVKQAGFNLVELMIAMVIGLVLMMSITTMFVDTKVSANRSSTVSSLQQQAQLALQILVEDVRGINSWAEFSGEGFTGVPSAVTAAIADGGCNMLPASVASSTSGISAGANVSTAGCLATGFTITDDSDVLFIARVRGTIIASGAVITNGNYVAISPSQATSFKGSTLPNIENADIYPYIHHTYFTQNHASEGSRLSRFSFIDNAFVNDLVVNNIERIRINFGVDSNGDGRANRYIESRGITRLMWDSNQIVAARIYVLARAKNKDLTLNNNDDFNDRFMPFDPPNDDNYRRFLLSTTVVIINNMMAVTQ